MLAACCCGVGGDAKGLGSAPPAAKHPASAQAAAIKPSRAAHPTIEREFNLARPENIAAPFAIRSKGWHVAASPATPANCGNNPVDSPHRACNLPVVYLAFSDESGTGSIKDEPIIAVAAVVINPDTQWDGVQADIDTLLLHVPEQRRNKFEFHASRLFGQLRKETNRLLLSGILSIPFRRHLPIFYAAADRNGVGKTIGSNDIDQITIAAQAGCFTMAAAQLEKAISTFQPRGQQEKILWIADNVKAAATMKAGLKLFQQTPMFADLPKTKFEHIIDTVYFGNSHESRPLQLADACNFVITKHLMKNAAIKPYYRLIEPQISGRQESIMFQDAT